MSMIVMDTTSFKNTMNNIVNYSLGYIEGIKKGKNAFLKNLGTDTIQLAYQYIDTNARMDHQALHHVYEWYKTGSPNARLFDIDYTVSSIGLSLGATFKQSQSTSKGSTQPFYNKAKIMEDGITVKISPKKGSVLVFEDNGETIFTKNPIVNDAPGGEAVRGSFEKVFDEFMRNYFSQAFLFSSGLGKYLSEPTTYKKNLSLGAKTGKSAGVSAGYKWIANAKYGGIE